MKRLFAVVAVLAVAMSFAAAADAPANSPDRFDIDAKLKGALAMDKVKDGDLVTLEVLKDVKIGDKVVIPKKATLTGKMFVQPAGLSFLIQKAEWQGGSMPLNAYIATTVAIAGSAQNGDISSGGVGAFNPNAPQGNDVTEMADPRKSSSQISSDTQYGGMNGDAGKLIGDPSSGTKTMLPIAPDAQHGSRIDVNAKTRIPNNTQIILRHLDPDYPFAFLLGDNPKARAAVQQARDGSAKGDAKDQFTLGSMYLQGAVVKKDLTKAAGWLLKAADQGVPEAQTDMGVLYIQGDGVQQDPVASYMWFKLATDAGQAQDQRALTMLEGQMKSEQIAEAKKRADDWKQQHKK
jgi:hypothetical protein